ncbi:HD-GYP domain-containing protein [Caldithrix abyssi]
MIKKIKVDKLKPGVFIADFNCSWLAHPFLVGKKRIRSYKDIEKIKRSGISEVYIDTTKGIDIVESFSREELLRYFEDAALPDISGYDLNLDVRVPLKKELKRAHEIQSKAFSVIKSAYQEARYGSGIKFDEINEMVKEIVESITRNHDALLLLSSLKEKDEYTFEHSMNVSVLTAGLCKALKMSKEEVIEFTLGSMLHDIGKSKIPSELLNKKMPLSPKEFELMKKHVDFGIELVKGHSGITDNIMAYIAEHHERENGTGYPRKLKSNEISRAGKIGAIVDVYDALTTDRVYHHALHASEAIKDMYIQRALHFDEELLEQFILFMGIYPPGSLVKLSSGFLAIVIETAHDNLLRPIVRLIYDLNKGLPIAPRNLDLSKGVGELHTIVGIAEPSLYKIDLNEYMLQMINA